MTNDIEFTVCVKEKKSKGRYQSESFSNTTFYYSLIAVSRLIRPFIYTSSRLLKPLTVVVGEKLADIYTLCISTMLTL
jgi:hypothetical protein